MYIVGIGRYESYVKAFKVKHVVITITMSDILSRRDLPLPDAKSTFK